MGRSVSVLRGSNSKCSCYSPNRLKASPPPTKGNKNRQRKVLDHSSSGRNNLSSNFSGQDTIRIRPENCGVYRHFAAFHFLAGSFEWGGFLSAEKNHPWSMAVHCTVDLSVFRSGAETGNPAHAPSTRTSEYGVMLFLGLD